MRLTPSSPRWHMTDERFFLASARYAELLEQRDLTQAQ